MSSSINASLTAGLVQTADTSGIINLQSGGTTVATISSTGLTSTGGALNGSLGATTPSTAVVTSLTDSGLTSGRVTYASTGGLLADSSSFTYNGSQLNLTGTAYGGLNLQSRTDAAQVSASLFFTTSTSGNYLMRGDTGSLAFLSGAIIGSNGGTERMRIDSSGNVGIGVTPSAWYLSNFVTAQVGASGLFSAKDGNDLRICSNTYLNTSGIYKYLNTAHATRYEQGAGTHAWYIAPSGTAGNTATFTQAMTLDASGNLVVGAGSMSCGSGLAVGTPSLLGAKIFFGAGVLTAGAGTYPLKWNSGTGIVTYDTSSRLVKENITDSPYGLAEVLKLQSRKYFRTDDQRDEIGLVADEVLAVMPEFVPMVSKSIFTKDDADTELIAGGVNYEKLTSVLVKAIQEQQALITSLTARLDEQQAQISVLQGAK